MKKLFMFFTMAVSLFVGNQALQAKPIKKSKAKKTSIIGSFTHNGGGSIRSTKTFHLLSNGKIDTKDRCLRGSYKKGKGGKYYRLHYIDAPSCGDFDSVELIVGNDIYYIWAGTDPQIGIDDFIYNSSDKTVTFVLPYKEDLDWFLELSGFESSTVPLSTFKKVGYITWKK